MPTAAMLPAATTIILAPVITTATPTVAWVVPYAVLSPAQTTTATIVTTVLITTTILPLHPAAATILLHPAVLLRPDQGAAVAAAVVVAVELAGLFAKPAGYPSRQNGSRPDLNIFSREETNPVLI